ncbi:type IV pili methyl-accepting chemotaxis transducer N-terminal domain-containing protein, partial [Thiolapillus sp.]
RRTFGGIRHVHRFLLCREIPGESLHRVRWGKQVWILGRLPYRLLVKTEPNLQQAPQVNAIADKMLKYSNRFVTLLEERSGTSKGRLINISDRQRMFSQRIAKFYVFKAWGLDTDEYCAECDKAVKEFSDALETLKKAPENTPEINEALDKVQTDWNTFKISFSIRGGKFIPSLVTRSLDNILKQMDRITAMYVAIY